MSSVAVVVLGDVGRSPRMQYHCTSLAALPATQVSLVGYRGERCIREVEDAKNIKKFLISTPFASMPRKLFLLYAPFKVLFQLLQLLFILLWAIPRPRAFLVQNPPSIPTLLVVWLAARLRGSRFVIDWHNFGYTVLALGLHGRSGWLVSIARAYECFMAQRADGHLCVTNAMRLWLWDNWRVRASVLYDRPPPFFRRASLAEKHELFSRLAPSLPTYPLPTSPKAAGAAASALGASGAAAGSAGAVDSKPPLLRDTVLTQLLPLAAAASSGTRAGAPFSEDAGSDSDSAAGSGSVAASSSAGRGSSGSAVKRKGKGAAAAPASGAAASAAPAPAASASAASLATPLRALRGAVSAAAELGPPPMAHAPPMSPESLSPSAAAVPLGPALLEGEGEGGDGGGSGDLASAGAAAGLTPAQRSELASLAVRDRPGRPAVIVSSTSWTEDEDFSILLAALTALDAAAVAAPSRFPDFLVLVTGKGPLKALYEARMAALPLKRVAIRTLWLAPGDYPLLLGCADLGVCLHFSTSGLDLPMKVVDMFGAGLPVCAVNFACLPELVRHDINGLVFNTADQLAQQLCDLFSGFPGGDSAKRLKRLRAGVRLFQSERWQDNWMRHASPFFALPAPAAAPASGRSSGGSRRAASGHRS